MSEESKPIAPVGASVCDICGRELGDPSESYVIAPQYKSWTLCLASHGPGPLGLDTTCYRIGYECERRRAESAEKELESCRARLSTAEKARDEALKDLEYERIHQRVAYTKVVAEAETAECALEKALGALRALLRLYDWRFVLAERERDPREEQEEFHAETRRLLLQYGTEKKAAWAAARAILSGGAHVDGPKAPKESFNQRTARAGLGHGPAPIDEDYPDALKAQKEEVK